MGPTLHSVLTKLWEKHKYRRSRSTVVSAAIQSILAMAAAEDLELHQINIKRAYLNGELTGCKVIFIQQPPGYHAPGLAKLVCQLRKTLYRLKQSGHQ